MSKTIIFISIVTVIFGMVGLWRWALYGMSREVSIAWVITTITTAFILGAYALYRVENL